MTGSNIKDVGPHFNIKNTFPGIGISIIKIRWSLDHVIFMMEIHSYTGKTTSSYWDIYIKTTFPDIGISIIKIRWSLDHVIFMMEIHSYTGKTTSSYWDIYIKTTFPDIGISIIKIRWSLDHYIFIMEINSYAVAGSSFFSKLTFRTWSCLNYHASNFTTLSTVWRPWMC